MNRDGRASLRLGGFGAGLSKEGVKASKDSTSPSSEK